MVHDAQRATTPPREGPPVWMGPREVIYDKRDNSIESSQSYTFQLRPIFACLSHWRVRKTPTACRCSAHIEARRRLKLKQNGPKRTVIFFFFFLLAVFFNAQNAYCVVESAKKKKKKEEKRKEKKGFKRLMVYKVCDREFFDVLVNASRPDGFDFSFFFPVRRRRHMYDFF